MAAERNFFHRWRGMTTIGYELGVIWEMSVKGSRVVGYAKRGALIVAEVKLCEIAL